MKAVILYTSFALTTGVVAVIMALVKIYLGYKLESEAMATDSELTNLLCVYVVGLSLCPLQSLPSNDWA